MIASAALDVGTFITNDLGSVTACCVTECGSFAIRVFGFLVASDVSVSLGSFIDCPRHEGPSLCKYVE